MKKVLAEAPSRLNYRSFPFQKTGQNTRVLKMCDKGEYGEREDEMKNEKSVKDEE